MGCIRVIRIGWANRLLTLSLLLAFASFVFASVPRVAAQGTPPDQPSGPDRYAVTVVDYTKYFWWMFYLGEDDVECEVEVDHEGLPTLGDVYVDCGEDLYEKWIKQKPCTEIDVRQCEGLYFQLVDTKPAQKEVSTALPPPAVQVTLENCDPVYTSSTSICASEPVLVLTGIEPLPEYQITSIEGLYEGQPFICDPVCRLQFPVTDEDGYVIQFWANSSYGDTSEMFEALVRVAVADVGDPDRLFWYVDVLSDQWVGVPIASCVQTWGTLPPVGGPPKWLSTPPLSEDLGTDIPYNYLASHLIRAGVVDVSSCPDGGLLPDGGASTCGIENARETVRTWQNQFDSIILSIAKDTGVPASLLKNMFAIESQFWPGSTPEHIGLGQFTEKGADTALLWNPPFFRQFCPLVMDSAECSQGYLHLSDEQQEYVRQALLNSLNATCETCPLGIDLDRANFSIGVFAHAMLANCEQAGQLVENVTGGNPAGNSASYEDLWKFTLVNYNAGPGCLGNALDATVGADLELTWENVASRLELGCQGAINYVDSISQTR